MNRLNRQQRKDIESFRSVTGTSERIAIDSLKASNWNLQRAVDSYFSYSHTRTTPKVQKIDKRNIDRLWNKYKDGNGDMMTANGVSQFCEDLCVDPSNVSLLIFSYYGNAEHMGMFKKEEFVSAMNSLGCDTIDKLRDRLPALQTELDSDSTFRRIYEFSFLFAREIGIKFVEKKMAIALWRLLFANKREWELLDDWCSFLESKDIIAIQKDTWEQLLDFAWTVRSDFSNFDPSGAWPYLIDEFVEYVCKAKGIEVPS